MLFPLVLARKRFEQYLKDPASLPADLRGIVYKTVLIHLLYAYNDYFDTTIFLQVVANGDQDAYDSVERIYRESELHEEKIRALTSLGYARQPSLIRRVLVSSSGSLTC